MKIGPFEEGREYRVRFWVAQELKKAGIARIKDDELLDSVKLFKIHWTERVQPVKQISPLARHFYPMLRWYLSKLKREAIKNPERVREYEKVKKLSQDILNCRLRKIVVLSSSPEKLVGLSQNLTLEEKWLYERLSGIVDYWRTEILSFKEEEID